MTPLLAVVKIFINNNVIYNKYNIYINYNYIKEQHKELFKIFTTLRLFKEKDPKNTSLDNFTVYFFAQYPAMRRDEVEFYTATFIRLGQLNVDEANIVAYLEEVKKREVASRVANKAIEVVNGVGKFEEIAEIAKDFEVKINETDESTFVTDDLEKVIAVLQGGGIRWRLKTLNAMLGPIRRGHNGLVFARPEVGKTTFLASEVTFMAEQVDGPILWVNNEQDGHEIMSRCYQASLGITSDQLHANFAAHREEFRKRTGSRIKLLDDANANKRQIENLCLGLKPKLLVFDQIDKIRGFEADRYDLQMKAVYQWARELAKRYGPVIGICQAGGTAENKKWLTMNDVDSSHTAKQGEVDWMLGVGFIHQEGFENERYLHLCKNKLTNTKDTIPALRHGKCPVRICPEIARYEDQLKF